MSKKKAPRRLEKNEASAVLRNLRISPRKLNLIAGLIRGRHVSDALDILNFTKRRAAGDVYKVLVSAIANAENNHGLDIDSLFVAEASVGKGIVMKRFHARARGRGARIFKPFSHLNIIVREQKGNA